MNENSKLLGIKSIFEMLGIIAVVISLVLVWLETRQNRILAEVNFEMTITQNRILANQNIVNYPDIWVKGCANDSLSPEEAVIFRAMIDDKNALFLYKVSKAIKLGDPATMSVEMADFVDFLYRNPGARAVWSEMEETLVLGRQKQNVPYVAGDWYQGIKAGLEKLDQLNTESTWQ